MAVRTYQDRSEGNAALAGKIGWLCHLVRYAALAYAGLALWMIIRFWFGGMAERVFRYRIGHDIGDMSAWQLVAGFGFSLTDWLLLAGAAYAGWRLTGEYLAGRTFSVEAATWLSRVGLFGLAALAFDIIARPILLMIAGGQFSAEIASKGMFFQPSDLLNGVFLLAFIALGHIFRTAAALADDHAQIV